MVIFYGIPRKLIQGARERLFISEMEIHQRMLGGNKN